MPYWSRVIPEQVISMAFSNNTSTLYALGSSGSLFTLEVGEVLSAYDSNDYVETWSRYEAMCEDRFNHLLEMGVYADGAPGAI